ncbi:MAG: PD40 domain-containing protein, partial [Acidobacteria bacterium]|nr:PD40 domain-containing protein [Acidobacteriota bacterium]
IVHAQPEALARFNYTLPARLEQIIRKCLEKEPDRRYQSARDVLIDLKNLKRDLEAGAAILERSAEQQPVPHHRGFVRSLWQGPSRAILAILIALGALTVAQIYFQRAPVEVRAVRSFVLPPENWSLALNNQLAVSPDGRRLAFIATTVEGNSLLWVRSLDTLSAQALAGTEGGRHPFWSRDSRFLGFFANGKLKKIDASGGPALALCDAPMGRGGTWNRDGVIIFAPFLTSALHRVSASGGVSSPVTELDEARGEGTHRWPHFLPDGQHFLYLARRDPRSESEGAIFVASLESKESKRLVPTNSNAAYAQGHLLFMRQETLMAQPFDPDRLEATGDAFPLADEIRYLPAPNTIGLFSVSQNGVLAYQSSREGRDRRLTWFDRNGKPLGVLGDVAHYGEFSLSPDNKRVLAVILEPKTGNRDLWNYEVTRNLRTRYTFDRASEGSPVWSPDGSSIILHSNRKGYHDLYQKAASGAGSEELLLESNISKYPTSRSPDGRFLLYHTVDSKTANDLWILPLQGDQESKIPRGEPFPFSHTEFNELRGQFSSDGRWVAYESNESGRGEIYVVPFPGPGAKRQISTSGGRRPIWRGDGKEIFYTTTPGNKLAAVEVNGDGATLEVGVMRPLFDYGGGEWDAYDVTADGQRFLISMAVEEKAPSPITLVQNWTADLKR